MIQGIVQLLIDSTHVASVVGNNTANNKPKIYPVVCPQGEAPPYITVHETGRVPIRCKGSRATDYSFTGNILCYGATYEDVNKMADAVELTLDNNKEKYKDLHYENRQDAFDNEAQLFIKIVQVAGMI